MFGTHDFALFLMSCVLLNLTPGQDTLYILGRGVGQGSRSAVISALGISSGCVVHTLAAAFGLSALLATSANAFEVLKWAGAAYLMFLGLRLLLASDGEHGPAASAGSEASPGVIYRQALLTNLLNPKVALFFLAFLPQFIDAGAASRFEAFLFLGACFITTGTCWCLLLALASGAISDMLRRRRSAARNTRRVAGAVFMLLGARLALSRR